MVLLLKTEKGRSDFAAALVIMRGSSGRTRTYNPSVNSRLLCQLSYRGKRADYNVPECLRQANRLSALPAGL